MAKVKGFRGTPIEKVMVVDRKSDKELERALVYILKSENVYDLQYAITKDGKYSALVLIAEQPGVSSL